MLLNLLTRTSIVGIAIFALAWGVAVFASPEGQVDIHSCQRALSGAYRTLYRAPGLYNSGKCHDNSIYLAKRLGDILPPDLFSAQQANLMLMTRTPDQPHQTHSPLFLTGDRAGRTSGWGWHAVLEFRGFVFDLDAGGEFVRKVPQYLSALLGPRTPLHEVWVKSFSLRQYHRLDNEWHFEQARRHHEGEEPLPALIVQILNDGRLPWVPLKEYLRGKTTPPAVLSNKIEIL